ncbi:MAG: hypothetical protein BGO26_17450 [Actinobacteria bacterium 69-20]|jgi:transcriptional regulator with XRE-family HTH domain|nr:helix-turn-helix transcriptional regulator [Actinomycetota bacterium]OJV26005.1 MAG: hypothetical protein BGO26_17450 [Actinobacteria bacterium 69-20]
MTAAEAIEELLARGLTKSELAACSGISRSLLDGYLSGRIQPSVAQLARLGASVGLQLDLAWSSAVPERVPVWARPNDAMHATPLTVRQRAEVLERVVDMGMALPRRQQRALRFPPFRTIRAGGAR